jgi:8-oxo-dGTP pyrophosphatase MutT (NUDIX family)
MQEIGTYPFVIKNRKIHVMLITNSSGKLWILPKGHPESDLKKTQVAKLESYEEAGVIGKIFNAKLNKEFKRDNGSTLLVYPLNIIKILNKWPEDNFRKRTLVNIKDALKLVTRKEHLNAIKYFSSPKISLTLIQTTLKNT